MAQALATYLLNATSVTAREAEVTAADFSGGGNKAGSNACGIGISTAVVNPKASDWPRAADTAPRESQHIGGDGLGAGDATSYDLNTVNGADVNNEVAFVAVDAGGAAADAVADVATGGVNRTGGAVVEGDYIWAEIPVA